MNILKVNKNFFYQNKEPCQQLLFYHLTCVRRLIQPIAIWLFISISLSYRKRFKLFHLPIFHGFILFQTY